MEPELPNSLDTPDFLTAWKLFLRHRVEKRAKLTPIAATRMLAKLAKYGPVVSVQAINRAIENGWQGIFPENETNGDTNPRRKSQTGIAPASDGDINDPAAHGKFIA